MYILRNPQLKIPKVMFVLIYIKRLLKLTDIKKTVPFNIFNSAHHCCEFSPSFHIYTLHKRLDHTVKAIPGLNFSFNANNWQKTVQNLLGNFAKCMIQKNIITWLTVRINSLSKHWSNSDNPLTPENFMEILKLQKETKKPLFTYSVKWPPMLWDNGLKQKVKPLV